MRPGRQFFHRPLIDLRGIQAKSIDSLVINGAISAPTKNPHDTSVTNDFRSVINVAGRIGSVVGVRSSLSGAIRADSIGSVRVANIAGEITTRSAETDLAINLPAAFKGFINSAGPLHIGFPLSDGSLITGQMTSGGGISGSDKDSQLDTIFLPDTRDLAGAGILRRVPQRHRREPRSQRDREGGDHRRDQALQDRSRPAGIDGAAGEEETLRGMTAGFGPGATVFP